MKTYIFQQLRILPKHQGDPEMPTVRINLKVTASEPVPESLGGTFEVSASGCVDVYRLLRDRIHDMPRPAPPTDPDIDSHD